MADEFEEQQLEPEIADALARHDECDYRPGEENEFWNDLGGRLRDALTPYAEQLWHDDYPFISRADKLRRQNRHWLCKAIDRAAPVVAAKGLNVAPLIWLRRYINGELPRDKQQASTVQDLVTTLTLHKTGKLGEHWPLPKLANVPKGVATENDDATNDEARSLARCASGMDRPANSRSRSMPC